MPANDFVFMLGSAERHHIERKQLGIFFWKVIPDCISANLSGSSLVNVTPKLNTLYIQFGTSCKNLCMKGDVNRMQTCMNLRKQ